MCKKLLIIFFIGLFLGCSHKEANNGIKIKDNRVQESLVPSNYIPEHIRRSHIEVVPHY